MKLIETIKTLNKGTKRLLTVLSIVIPLLIGTIIIATEDGVNDGLELFAALTFATFFFFVIFWIIVLIILWINQGYNDENTSS